MRSILAEPRFNQKMFQLLSMNMILRRQYDGGDSDELHDLFLVKMHFASALDFSRAFGPKLRLQTKKKAAQLRI